MNYRYQVIVFAFLALAIHFHSGESVGTISLAQTAESAVAVVRPPKPADDPNLEFKGETDKGNSYRFTVVQRQKSDSADDFFSKGQDLKLVLRATDESGDALKLFGDCGCLMELSIATDSAKVTTKEELIAAAKANQTLEAAIAKAKNRIDVAAEEKKKEEDAEKERKEKCEDGTGQVQVKCLVEKIASTKKPEVKSELQDRLTEMLDAGLNDQGNEDAALDVIKSNKDILKSLKPAQQTNIKQLGAQVLAGRNAYKASEDLKSLASRKSGVNYDQAVSKNLSAQATFRREYSAIFGTSTQGAPASVATNAWNKANLKNKTIINNISGNLNLGNLEHPENVAFMEDASDIQPSVANVNPRTRNVNGTEGTDGTIGGRGRQINRRLNNQAYGTCNPGTRPSGNGACSFSGDIFENYMKQLQAINTNTNQLGNFGLRTNMLQNTMTQPGQFSNQSNFTTPTTTSSGRQGGRPTG